MRLASEPSDPVPIALGPVGDAGPRCRVSFRVQWANGAPFDGSLLLRIATADGGKRTWITSWMPVIFRGGRAPLSLPLAEGRYAVRARGHEGSSLSWTTPVERAPFDVVAGRDEEEVSVTLAGGIVKIAPQTEDGVSIREFSYTLTSKTAQVSVDTWLSAVPYQRPIRPDLGGLLLYLDAGSVEIRLKKDGYLPVTTSIDVAEDGTPVEWSPTLKRSGR